MPQVPKKEFYCPCGSVSLSHMEKNHPLAGQVLLFHFWWSCIFLNRGDCQAKCWQNHLWSTSTEKGNLKFKSNYLPWLFWMSPPLSQNTGRKTLLWHLQCSQKTLVKDTTAGQSCFLRAIYFTKTLTWGEGESFAAGGLLPCCPFHYGKSPCRAGEGADQLTQHPAQAVEGDKLLGIPALKNHTSVSAKEHRSQLEFARHICKSKRFNGCETDHSLSWLLNPHWKSAPTWLSIQSNSQVKQTCPQLRPKDNCCKWMRKK